MVARCKSCKEVCISWASNKQTCKCENIMGFNSDEIEIQPLTENPNKVELWDGSLQSWIEFDIKRVFERRYWHGFAGEPFSI